MITITDLTKYYRRKKVLDQVSLTIPDGQIFALLGPNGSGKSTLLKSILGTVFPLPKSTIVLNGSPILGTSDYKHGISYMPQQPNFPPHLKVHELIRLFEQLRQQCPEHDPLKSDLGIHHFWEKPIIELSGGMVQKMNIFQCFMFSTNIFILDEPTSGLDPSSSFYLKNLIREKRRQGKTVILTSHIMAEVEELADLMALMIEGSIYTITSPKAMKAKTGSATLEEALYEFWNERRT